MPESIQVADKGTRWARLRGFLAPAAILLIAGGLVAVIAGDWNTWTGNRAEEETDDAYVRADLTPLSTKVAGLVAQVAVSDYQTVKAGDLLVQLRDDDFRAQVQQAEAAVTSGEDSLINNHRQKDLQDARIVQAQDGIQSAGTPAARRSGSEEGIAVACANESGLYPDHSP
jgi:membrane fusion protein (multidrug efflux system)